MPRKQQHQHAKKMKSNSQSNHYRFRFLAIYSCERRSPSCEASSRVCIMPQRSLLESARQTTPEKKEKCRVEARNKEETSHRHAFWKIGREKALRSGLYLSMRGEKFFSRSLPNPLHRLALVHSERKKKSPHTTKAAPSMVWKANFPIDNIFLLVTSSHSLSLRILRLIDVEKSIRQKKAAKQNTREEKQRRGEVFSVVLKGRNRESIDSQQQRTAAILVRERMASQCAQPTRKTSRWSVEWNDARFHTWSGEGGAVIDIG